jgi:hypothetical protein
VAKEKVIKQHEFITHKMGCDQCYQVTTDKPATLQFCCLIGEPLLRDYLNFMVSPEYRKQQSALKREFQKEVDGKSYKTTKAKLNEVMRFK